MGAGILLKARLESVQALTHSSIPSRINRLCPPAHTLAQSLEWDPGMTHTFHIPLNLACLGPISCLLRKQVLASWYNSALGWVWSCPCGLQLSCQELRPIKGK